MARSNLSERTLAEKMAQELLRTGKSFLSRADVESLANEHHLPATSVLNKAAYRIGRNQYAPPGDTPASPAVASPIAASGRAEDEKPTTEVLVTGMVPVRDASFVPFGRYGEVNLIVESRRFYPVYVVGLSGFGKTTMIEQACAQQKREVIRVNVSIETDEDDLIGGFVLENGNVVFREGPVLVAMRRGAVLILDEIDRGSNKLMCLQAILEGKPYYNKKTNRVYEAVPGFNIFATGNTKGQGIEEGKYMSAQILDDAFLERFALTLEQDPPLKHIEKKILMRKMAKAHKIDEPFANKLCTWAEIIRKTYKDGGVDDVVSTRRLEHIVNAFSLFNDRLTAVNHALARFDGDTKKAFMDLYTKVDDSVTIPDEVQPTT